MKAPHVLPADQDRVRVVRAAMPAGGTHIDHVNLLRAGATQRVLPFKIWHGEFKG